MGLKHFRDCMYCKKMFDCKGREENTKNCINFVINKARENDYRLWLEERNKK